MSIMSLLKKSHPQRERQLPKLAHHLVSLLVRGEVERVRGICGLILLRPQRDKRGLLWFSHETGKRAVSEFFPIEFYQEELETLILSAGVESFITALYFAYFSSLLLDELSSVDCLEVAISHEEELCNKLHNLIASQIMPLYSHELATEYLSHLIFVKKINSETQIEEMPTLRLLAIAVGFSIVLNLIIGFSFQLKPLEYGIYTLCLASCFYGMLFLSKKDLELFQLKLYRFSILFRHRMKINKKQNPEAVEVF